MKSKTTLKRTLPTPPPFRHDIVGSFLRPESLKMAREAYKKGTISIEILNAVEDQEIVRLVNKQKKVGLQVVTDGEFRRSWWDLDFFWGFEGVEKSSVEDSISQDKLHRNETARLEGKISLKNHPFLEHYRFLEKICDYEVIAKQTIPAPAQMLAELQRKENRNYTLSFYPEQ